MLTWRTPACPDRSQPRGSVLVTSLFMMVLLSLMGLTLLSAALTESTVAMNSRWSQGALLAAEAGLNQALQQLNPNTTANAVAAIPVTALGNGYSFRSGRRVDAGAQPLTLLGQVNVAGNSLDLGSAYNPAGQVYLQYQVNVTGIGPMNATREVEAQVQVGPVGGQ
jgi:Tfp pilus assembly protein PilX